MALPVFDAVSGGVAGAGSITVSHTVGSSADRVLYAWVVHQRTDFDVETVTYGGNAMTKVGASVVDGNSTLSLWRRLAPTSGTADIVATMEFSSTAQLRLIGLSYSGVDQTTPDDARVTATAAFSVGDTITTDQRFAVGFGVYDAAGPFGPTFGVTGTDQTLREDVWDAFGVTGLAVSDQTGSGAVTSTFTYSLTAEGRSLLGLAVNGIAAPPAEPERIRISFRPPA